jgi:hypothetical protein
LDEIEEHQLKEGATIKYTVREVRRCAMHVSVQVINMHATAEKKSAPELPKNSRRKEGHAPSYTHHTAFTFTCQRRAQGRGRV